MAKFVAGKSVVQNCGEYVIVRAEDLQDLLATKAALPAIIERIKQAKTLRDLKNAVNELPHGIAYDVPHFFFEEDLAPVMWGHPNDGPLVRYRARDHALTLDEDDPAFNSLEDFDWDTTDDLQVSRELVDACIDRIGADPDVGVLPLEMPSVMDTELCYRVINAIPELRPHATFATHNLDAGFRELDAPVALLEALGHEVTRDDKLIARVCS